MDCLTRGPVHGWFGFGFRTVRSGTINNIACSRGRRPTDRGGFNRSEVEARLALSHSSNQVGRDLEVTLAVGLGGQAAVGAVDDFRAVARFDGRAGDIAGQGDFVGDARMAATIGDSADTSRGTGFRDGSGEVLWAGWPE